MATKILSTKHTEGGEYIIRRSDVGYFTANFSPSDELQNLIMMRSRQLICDKQDELLRLVEAHERLITDLMKEMH